MIAHGSTAQIEIEVPACRSAERASAPVRGPVRAGRARDALAIEIADAIRGMLAGDPDALPSLVRRVTPWLYRIAANHRLDHHTAEDVVQETLLVLVQRIREVRDADAGLAWLSVVARRQSIRMLRSGRRVEVADDRLDWNDLPADEAGDPEQRAVDAERADVLASAIDGLPERCGRLLRLAFLEDERDYATISRTLDMPVGSIGPTRQRALRKMRDSLVGSDGGSVDLL